MENKSKDERKGKFNGKKALVLMAVSLSMVIFLAGCQTTGGSQPYISVNGNGNVKAEPDTADLTITVISESKDKSAQEANAKKVEKIIEVLKEIGLEEKEIKTSSVNFYQNIRWENGREVNYGYKAENSLQIKTKKIDLLGQITDQAVANGAERVSGLNFSLSTEGKANLMDQVIASATADAKVQAEAAAKSLGTSVTGVKSVHIIKESSPYVYRVMSDMAMAKSEEEASTPIMPGELDYSISAAVEFFIK